MAQYIGEMCRYILSSPPKAEDKEHKVRLVFGNGLRPQIWKEFVERFDIQQVAEFYGATEGNANIGGFTELSSNFNKNVYLKTSIVCGKVSNLNIHVF